MEVTQGGVHTDWYQALRPVEYHQEVVGEGQEGDIINIRLRLKAQAD